MTTRMTKELDELTIALETALTRIYEYFGTQDNTEGSIRAYIDTTVELWVDSIANMHAGHVLTDKEIRLIHQEIVTRVEALEKVVESIRPKTKTA